MKDSDILLRCSFLQEPRTAGPLPVMVWFHGGGWECGSGISPFYGHDFLLDHDIIFVSGNFRLGPLGFLSTETTDCPGNFGLKDQLEVLKWVNTNIAAFNGDPQSITVFGESAGGASLTYHMLSDKSKGSSLHISIIYVMVVTISLQVCSIRASLNQALTSIHGRNQHIKVYQPREHVN